MRSKVDFNNLTDSDLANMSKEELIAFIGGTKTTDIEEENNSEINPYNEGTKNYYLFEFMKIKESFEFPYPVRIWDGKKYIIITKLTGDFFTFDKGNETRKQLRSLLSKQIKFLYKCYTKAQLGHKYDIIMPKSKLKSGSGSNAATPLTISEYHSILEYLDRIINDSKSNRASIRSAKRHHLIYRLLAYTGDRISDVLNLRKSDFIDTNGNIKYSFSIKAKKTGKVRSHHIKDDNLKKELSTWILNLKSSDLLFSIGRTSVNSMLKKIAEELEFNKEVSPHSFRKLYALLLLDAADGKVSVVTQDLGHSSSSITMQYLKLEEKELNTIKSKMPTL